MHAHRRRTVSRFLSLAGVAASTCVPTALGSGGEPTADIRNGHLAALIRDVKTRGQSVLHVDDDAPFGADGDLDGDGGVGLADLSLLLENFGVSCR